jgi:hypothetical protein
MVNSGLVGCSVTGGPELVVLLVAVELLVAVIVALVVVALVVIGVVVVLAVTDVVFDEVGTDEVVLDEDVAIEVVALLCSRRTRAKVTFRQRSESLSSAPFGWRLASTS